MVRRTKSSCRLLVVFLVNLIISIISGCCYYHLTNPVEPQPQFLLGYIENLKSLYNGLPEVPGIEFLWYDKTAVNFTSPVFFKLDLRQNHTDCSEFRFDNLFQYTAHGQRQRILIQGRPGTGKTTLVNRLTKDWSSGKRNSKISDCIILLRVTMKEMEREGPALSLSDLLSMNDNIKTVDKKLADEYLSEPRNAESLCIIFDGLDEYPPAYTDPNNFINKIIVGKQLPTATVIVFSRPEAYETFFKKSGPSGYQVYELGGFNCEGINEYVKRNIDNDESAYMFGSHFNEHPELYQLCTYPLHLAMYVESFKAKNEFSSSLTEAYVKSLSKAVKREITRQGPTTSACSKIHLYDLPSLRECNSDFADTITNVSRLAFDSLMTYNSTQTQFLSTELHSYLPSFYTYGLLSLNYNTDEYYTVVKKFFFPHIVVQEFWAAFYVKIIAEVEISEFEEHIFLHPNFFYFVCGMYSSNTTVLEQVFQVLLKFERTRMFYDYTMCGFESGYSDHQLLAETYFKVHGTVLDLNNLTHYTPQLVKVKSFINTIHSNITEIVLTQHSPSLRPYVDNITDLFPNLNQVTITVTVNENGTTQYPFEFIDNLRLILMKQRRLLQLKWMLPLNVLIDQDFFDLFNKSVAIDVRDMNITLVGSLLDKVPKDLDSYTSCYSTWESWPTINLSPYTFLLAIQNFTSYFKLSTLNIAFFTPVPFLDCQYIQNFFKDIHLLSFYDPMQYFIMHDLCTDSYLSYKLVNDDEVFIKLNSSNDSNILIMKFHSGLLHIYKQTDYIGVRVCKYPEVSRMCSNPLHLAMIIEDTDEFSSLTEACVYSQSNTFKQEITQQNSSAAACSDIHLYDLASLRECNSDLADTITNISRLAFDSFGASNSTQTEFLVTKLHSYLPSGNTYGLLSPRYSTNEYGKLDKKFVFPHIVVQEFWAAFHVTVVAKFNASKFIDHIFLHPNFLYTVCGMYSSNTTVLNEIFQMLLRFRWTRMLQDYSICGFESGYSNQLLAETFIKLHGTILNLENLTPQLVKARSFFNAINSNITQIVLTQHSPSLRPCISNVTDFFPNLNLVTIRVVHKSDSTEYPFDFIDNLRLLFTRQRRLLQLKWILSLDVLIDQHFLDLFYGMVDIDIRDVNITVVGSLVGEVPKDLENYKNCYSAWKSWPAINLTPHTFLYALDKFISYYKLSKLDVVCYAPVPFLDHQYIQTLFKALRTSLAIQNFTMQDLCTDSFVRYLSRPVDDDKAYIRLKSGNDYNMECILDLYSGQLQIYEENVPVWSTYPESFRLCTYPLHLVIFVKGFKDKLEFSSLTEACVNSQSKVIKQEIKQQNLSAAACSSIHLYDLASLRECNSDLADTITNISRLAYRSFGYGFDLARTEFSVTELHSYLPSGNTYGLLSPRYSTDIELIKNIELLKNIGLVENNELDVKNVELVKKFVFPHIVVQEFWAAFHVTVVAKFNMSEFMQHFYLHPNFLYFVCGMYSSNTAVLRLLILTDRSLNMFYDYTMCGFESGYSDQLLAETYFKVHGTVLDLKYLTRYTPQLVKVKSFINTIHSNITEIVLTQHSPSLRPYVDNITDLFPNLNQTTITVIFYRNVSDKYPFDFVDNLRLIFTRVKKLSRLVWVLPLDVLIDQDFFDLFYGMVDIDVGDMSIVVVGSLAKVPKDLDSYTSCYSTWESWPTINLSPYTFLFAIQNFTSHFKLSTLKIEFVTPVPFLDCQYIQNFFKDIHRLSFSSAMQDFTMHDHCTGSFVKYSVDNVFIALNSANGSSMLIMDLHSGLLDIYTMFVFKGVRVCKYPEVYRTCSNPLHLAMIIKDTDEFSSLTEACVYSQSNTFKQEITQQNSSAAACSDIHLYDLASLRECNSDLADTITNISRLAFDSSGASKSTQTEFLVTELHSYLPSGNTYGLLSPRYSTNYYGKLVKKFVFPHIVVQEFWAAFHVTVVAKFNVSKFIDHIFLHPNFVYTVCGMYSSNTTVLNEIFQMLLRSRWTRMLQDYSICGFESGYSNQLLAETYFKVHGTVLDLKYLTRYTPQLVKVKSFINTIHSNITEIVLTQHSPSLRPYVDNITDLFPNLNLTTIIIVSENGTIKYPFDFIDNLRLIFTREKKLPRLEWALPLNVFIDQDFFDLFYGMVDINVGDVSIIVAGSLLGKVPEELGTYANCSSEWKSLPTLQLITPNLFLSALVNFTSYYKLSKLYIDSVTPVPFLNCQYVRTFFSLLFSNAIQDFTMFDHCTKSSVTFLSLPNKNDSSKVLISLRSANNSKVSILDLYSGLMYTYDQQLKLKDCTYRYLHSQ